MLLKGNNEKCLMYSKSDNKEIMIGNDDTNQFFLSLLHRYQKGLEKLMRGINFVFDNVDGLHCKLHEKSVNHGGSYIDFSG